MNFLAHAYLSGNNPGILVGNFIGDFVKGRQALESLDAEMVKGIELHRLIDEFTDDHPIVHQSKNRLRPKYRHYAAVIIDVFYDHYLARYWNNYHATPLDEYANYVYQTVGRYDPLLPQGVKHMLPYMITGNWLVNYSKLEGINSALTGMARRTPYKSKMDEAVHDLERYYDEFKAEFEQFFPELETKAKNFLNEIK